MLALQTLQMQEKNIKQDLCGRGMLWTGTCWLRMATCSARTDAVCCLRLDTPSSTRLGRKGKKTVSGISDQAFICAWRRIWVQGLGACARHATAPSTHWQDPVPVSKLSAHFLTLNALTSTSDKAMKALISTSDKATWMWSLMPGHAFRLLPLPTQLPSLYI